MILIFAIFATIMPRTALYIVRPELHDELECTESIMQQRLRLCTVSTLTTVSENDHQQSWDENVLHHHLHHPGDEYDGKDNENEKEPDTEKDHKNDHRNGQVDSQSSDGKYFLES